MIHLKQYSKQTAVKFSVSVLQNDWFPKIYQSSCFPVLIVLDLFRTVFTA